MIFYGSFAFYGHDPLGVQITLSSFKPFSDGGSFFYFSVMSLLLKLRVLFRQRLTCRLPSWYLRMGLGQGWQKVLRGKMSWLIFLIVQGNKNNFLAPYLDADPPRVIRSHAFNCVIPQLYSFVFIPLLKDSGHITFLAHIVCLKIHLESCPIWK